jgi:hypothetical protein
MRRTAAEQGAELGTEVVPAEVDLSGARVERVGLAVRLLRAVVAEEAARGQDAVHFGRRPQALGRWAV